MDGPRRSRPHSVYDLADATPLDKKSLNPFCRTRRSSLLPADRLHEHSAHLVRVHVRGRAAVFEVPLPCVGRLHGDAHGGAAVADAITEAVDGGGLMLSRQPLLVVRTVDGDVLVMA